jgi:hypothetical protein
LSKGFVLNLSENEDNVTSFLPRRRYEIWIAGLS